MKSYSDRGLDRGVRVVAFQREILVAEILEVLHVGIEQHSRERARFAGELDAGLLQMIGIKMEIAESVDKLLGFESADLRHHEGKQSVGGDIERDAKEEVGTPLVELAAEFTVCNIELEESVAGGESHLV